MAEVFEPPSRAFLEASLPTELDLVLDLGCGPGHTTRLLAEVGRPRRVLGLDRSEPFLAVARRLTNDPTVRYLAHDVALLPLPEAPADALHVRLLLAHLPDPLGLVAQWRTQLRPGGVLLVDEVESIEAPPGVLRAYEDVAVALVAAEGGPMYAGPALAPLGGRCVEVPVDAAVAARMYAMNLTVWRDGAEARGIASAHDLDAIAAGLAGVVDAGPGRATVRWVLRQLVVPRQ